jgi:ABC-2 type transport system permease protein
VSVAALVLYNEARKGMVITWGYRANLVTELLTLFFVFIFVSYFIGGGELESEQLPTALLGYLIWFYAAIAISSMSGNLTGEASTGTLEQLYMSPMPSWLVFVGRVISTFLTSTVMVAILALTLILVMRISFPFTLEALPPFVLTMVGLFGFGYAIGGLTLVYKQIGSVNSLVTNMLLFMNGALLPVHFFPAWLETFARLLPTTQGIIVMRKVIIDGESLAAVWADGSMVYLAVQSTIFLLAGWVIFNIGERFAKRRGTLGQY